MKNAFTVDLEDWYQGVGKPMSEWEGREKRLRIGHDFLLNLFSKNNFKATYFILGKVVEDHPDMIKEIIDEGHEISCHSYAHPFIYEITQEAFDEDIAKCVELIKPFGVNYVGFRAPYFSVDHRSMWALDVLKKYNFTYDSSIYPGDSKRTGIVGYPKEMHRLDNGLIEVPVSTFKMLPFDVGLGGAYFRILPYLVFKQRFNSIRKEGRPGIFYIHPWELDPKHPYLSDLPKRIRIPHYKNLNKTGKKLERLVKDFEFCSLKELIDQNFKN